MIRSSFFAGMSCVLFPSLKCTARKRPRRRDRLPYRGGVHERLHRGVSAVIRWQAADRAGQPRRSGPEPRGRLATVRGPERGQQLRRSWERPRKAGDATSLQPRTGRIKPAAMKTAKKCGRTTPRPRNALRSPLPAQVNGVSGTNCTEVSRRGLLSSRPAYLLSPLPGGFVAALASAHFFRHSSA